MQLSPRSQYRTAPASQEASFSHSLCTATSPAPDYQPPCSPSEPIAATHTLSLQADVILGPLSPFTTRKAPSPVHSASLQSPAPTLLSHRLSLDWHSSLGALCPQPCPGPFSPHHQHLCSVRLPCRWGCLEICRRLLPVQPMTMALRGECQPVLID